MGEKEFTEKIVQVNRVSKKTKGGNKIGFSILVVIGDKKGRVGAGLGKAADVVSSIKKAVAYAKKHMITVPLKDQRTLPHQLTFKYGAARLILKPAPVGSGIIAGGAVRIVMEVAGVKDVVGKMVGSRNKITNVYATLAALSSLHKSN